ncbi:MAG: outer membrane beta-barrel protein [Salinivirgaceae bacterium]
MKKIVVLVLAFAIFQGKASNTETAAPKKGEIYGTIIDASTKRFVEYATIALYSNEDKLITGGISDNEGYFRLKNTPAGTYKITITFMGYKTLDVPNIKITPETKEVDLGNILLHPNVKEIEAVNVVADQASVQYRIDKKVVNVSQQLTAKSGTAVDILENVPSVKVDIEGNVTLRGSSSFTVLIDGRPTALEPSDALSQIPAGAIENIEIITNPSAKYEPDGTSGIVNIITKKNRLNGISGIVNANVGSQERYGADFTLDWRQEKWHFYVGGDYNHMTRNGTNELNRWSKLPTSDSTFYTLSDGEFLRERESASFNGGIDWSFTEKDVIGLNVNAGVRDMGGSSSRNYTQWYDLGTDTSLYITDENSTRGGSFISATLDYKHTFNGKKEHYLQAQFYKSYSDMSEEAENYSRLYDQTIFEGKRTTEDGPSDDHRIKIDYSQPLDWGGKFESGFHVNLDNSPEHTTLQEYNTTTQTFDPAPEQFDNKTAYKRNTYAAYGILGGEWGDFGYQAGLRMEYTYQLLELVKTGESYKIDRPDLFPTLHFSYNLPANQQAMISYTRRIERPRGWFLEPFITYMDANNVRQGNPGLIPEYVNSMDLGYQKKFKQNFVSVEAYYRVTQNKIERINQPYNDEGVWLQTFENIGTDYALGVEFMANLNPAKWYTTNLMADLYDYRLKGTLADSSINQHDFSWTARWNNTFKAGPNTRFQFDVFYRSPSVTAQGRSEGFFSTSAAVKQDFFKRKLSATLQVRDVFGTWQHEHTTYGVNSYAYSLFKPNSPFVTLSLTYKLNNYNKKRNGGGQDSGGDMEEGGEF